MPRVVERLPQLSLVPVIGILRQCPRELVRDVVEIASDAGLKTIEVTLDGDEPFAQIRTLADAFPEVAVGAGTVLESRQASRAISEGASFVVSPVTIPEVLQVCLDADVPCLPGAATPTEIWKAHRLGATGVKVFPARDLGGPRYISSLTSVLAGVQIVPTGGIAIEEVPSYLASGATGIGLGGSLFPPALLESRDLRAIADLVSNLVGQTT